MHVNNMIHLNMLTQWYVSYASNTSATYSMFLYFVKLQSQLIAECLVAIDSTLCAKKKARF